MTLTVTIAEIKIEDNVTQKAFILEATIDNGGKVLNIFTLNTNSAWIIDSSATYHMTFDSKQVSPLNLYHKKMLDKFIYNPLMLS